VTEGREDLAKSALARARAFEEVLRPVYAGHGVDPNTMAFLQIRALPSDVGVIIDYYIYNHERGCRRV